MADTFDDGDVSSREDDEEGDVRQRLMRQPSSAYTPRTDAEDRPDRPQERVTEIPHFATSSPPRRGPGTTPFTTLSTSNDGVFANLDAKPEFGEKLEEQPPV